MSSATTVTPVVLEPAAQEFANATANPPYLFDLGPVEGRKTVDQVQSSEIEKPEVDIEDTTVPGGPSGEVSLKHTTPDPIEIHRLAAALKRDGVEHLAFEASSDGLDQHRIDGLEIGAAAFTNITRDHLDYHPSFEAYLAAKLRLFSEVVRDNGLAVVNTDAPCADAQGAGDEVIDALVRTDLEGAPVTPAERELLRLVELLTRHAYKTTDEDIERLRRLGWTDPQIAEAVYVTALFAFFNRVADAFGIVSQGYGGPQLPPEGTP